MKTLANLFPTVRLTLPSQVTTQELYKPMNNFLDLLMDGLTIAGILVLIFAVVMFCVSLATHEASQKITAAIGLMIACLLIGIRFVIQFITG